MQRCCRLSFLDDQDHFDSGDGELGDVDIGDDDIDDVDDDIDCVDVGDNDIDGVVDDIDGVVDDEDDLNPSQCFVSADSWSDSCQKQKPVHL